MCYNKEVNRKHTKIIIIILGIITAVLAFVFLFIFVISQRIVIDDCASPCRHDRDKTKPCIALCDQITLYDIIFGHDEWPTK